MRFAYSVAVEDRRSSNLKPCGPFRMARIDKWKVPVSYLARALLILLGASGGWASRSPAADTGPPAGADDTGDRAPANDGVNCLYAQLRLLGYRDAYPVYRQRLPLAEGPVTIDALAAAARSLGYDMVPLQLTVDELARLSAPVIVHFEENSLERGRFHLFLGLAEDRAYLVDGTRVTVSSMPRDNFRRNWTGFALVNRPARAAAPRIRRAIAVTSFLLLGAGIVALRSGKRRYLVPGRTS
jgi:hypothetical protein